MTLHLIIPNKTKFLDDAITVTLGYNDRGNNQKFLGIMVTI
jgi:hypothetical protein